MVATFVSKAGHIATITLNEQRTVTEDWYTTVCLPKVITELPKINPERRIILHQDNASSHTAQKTRQYLTEENVELLDHPPYSPNDFFTFPKIKNRLGGQRFQSPEEAVDAFKNAVLDLPANEWNKCFENWFERMKMCINLDNKTVKIRGNMNAQRYIHEVLEPHLLPYLDTLADPTFQQDNARPHVVRVTIDFFQHNDVTLLPWPPRSPDLSPIEHGWDMMGRRLLNLQRPLQTLEALREELVEDIDHLIRSMPRRVGECVAHQGASTHY
ncbi:unnamed protein product [Acanthoscelides obtectus]|uniref:Tc1-like transposase DDE domain-containing protein n=1 Tax=Acanthoscelides obtectus TaxID=200917 RepID=A0A9P0MDJ5_ACAOB|nr:unnamed protein product [Acanthoscelides obtectus]CAK1677622.1 Transposable element Tc3 transposase [Acanthoscelides obtectus]